METTPAKPSSPAKVFLRCSGLSKAFKMGDSLIQVLKHVDLTVKRGEFVAIEGRSGSGKSTLMHLLGALDVADSGGVEYDGREYETLSASQRSFLRNRHFGFVFQFYHLLPELNVLDNTLLPSMVQHSWLSFHARKPQLRERARQLLDDLGLAHRLKHRPNQLSGGERQRVAIARALMNEPKVLFADEPTGNLDAETGLQIMSVLQKLHRQQGQTIVMVTHDRELAREQADRVMLLQAGRLAAEK
ncbi:MAG: ABC transporter ATP-binding protein [Tepidisphaeraceae bacterium]|jgi:lipoprotein-releasing system ATP-binding protein